MLFRSCSRTCSVVFIKFGLIPIRPKHDVRHPRLGSSHLFADSFQINTGIAFDDQFIMHVPDDEAVSECSHSIAEDIAGYCLDDVLHELRTIGFDAFPFLCGANAFIGDGFSAELIGADPWFHIGKPAS